MIDIKTNKRLCNIYLWLFGLALLVILISCSPLSELPVSTVTAPIETRPAQDPTLPNPTATKAAERAQSCQVLTGIPSGHLNMRAGAGVSYAVIRVLAEGESLQVIKRAAWLEVIDSQGKQGFVNSRFCK